MYHVSAQGVGERMINARYYYYYYSVYRCVVRLASLGPRLSGAGAAYGLLHHSLSAALTASKRRPFGPWLLRNVCFCDYT